MFLFYFFSRHCFKYHVCICILGHQDWSLICLPGEIYDLFNVKSNSKCSLIYSTWFLEKHAPHLVCIWSLFHLQRTILYCFLFHIKSFMSDRLNHCMCIISREPRGSQLCRYLAEKTTHFKSLYIGIYLFLEQKKKRQCTIWDDMARTYSKTDPASPRGVNGIYSVYFLHAVHINPQRCRYTAHIMFHSALVFQGNIHHTLSHTELSKR